MACFPTVFYLGVASIVLHEHNPLCLEKDSQSPSKDHEVCFTILRTFLTFLNHYSYTILKEGIEQAHS